MIRAGAVASGGTMPMIGAKNMNGKNRRPQTTATQPVRPPTLMPEADSMYVVADELDAAPPATAERESTSSGFRSSGSSPRSSRYPACFPTPTIVPIVSKKSAMKSVNAQMTAERKASSVKASKLKLPSSARSGVS